MARRAPAKPPGRYHHGELRRALLDAALALIERDGVSALSLRELARRLGVSHAAPAHHFADKTALVVEIAREGYERFGAALAAAGAAAPGDPLAAIGRAYVAFALAHPATFRVMFGREVAELREVPPGLAEASRRAYEVLLGAVEATLADTPPARRPPAEHVAFVAWSAVHGAATLWLEGPLRCGVPEPEARARFEAGLDFLFHAAGAAGRRLSGGGPRKGKRSRAGTARTNARIARRTTRRRHPPTGGAPRRKC